MLRASSSTDEDQRTLQCTVCFNTAGVRGEVARMVGYVEEWRQQRHICELHARFAGGPGRFSIDKVSCVSLVENHFSKSLAVVAEELAGGLTASVKPLFLDARTNQKMQPAQVNKEEHRSHAHPLQRSSISRSNEERKWERSEQTKPLNKIPPFSQAEVFAAIQKLQKMKASTRENAEKNSCPEIKRAIREMFNNVITTEVSTLDEFD